MNIPIPDSGQARRAPEPFPVVGIGASAGGLEALTQLFSHLPEHIDMAFVVIQHLEPSHKSELTGLLSKTTAMPVTQAREGMAIRPGHAYVIPPGSVMTMARGSLHLTPRRETSGLHLPVNKFLQSLAEDRQAQAIGVILSGTGSDGAQGLAAVKAAGGVTFAQEEGSARHAGMPRSAAAGSAMDFILPPEEIARELVRMSRHPYLVPEGPDPEEDVLPESGVDLAPIMGHLRSATGVDFTQYRGTTLKRRILRRMMLRKRESLADYVQLLEDDRPEVGALYQDILINVTGFFREPEAFEALKAHAFPEIHKRKSPGEPVRVWVVGCATGEEAYSLAIALVEFQEGRPGRPPIRIFASDIDPAALEKARAGIYPDPLLSDVSPERLSRFFSKEDGGYRIHKAIRDLCIFARHDVTADTPFSRMDLISCRNVLIYLSPSLQRRVLPIFHYALNPTGFLLLGKSESVGRSTDLFSPVDAEHKLYARKMTANRVPLQVFAPGYTAAAPDITGSEPHHPTVTDFQQGADRLLLRRFAPPSVLINKDLDILQFRGRTVPFLEPPQREAAFSLVKMAHESLFLPLRSAIQEAEQSGTTVRRQGLRVRDGSRFRKVDVEVLPVKLVDSTETCFLVLFEEPADRHPHISEAPERPGPRDNELVRLRQELSETKDYLHSLREQYDAVNEAMKSSGEEMLSSNEELQSTNEELETAKEELQSTNEELSTLNDELQSRNLELGQLNNDLGNLLASLNIPIVMLDGNLRIRRFTQTAGKDLHLRPEDIGRPIGDLQPVPGAPDLEQSVREVIATAEPAEREVRNGGGRWHQLRMHPYRTSDNRLDGAVLVFLDIDASKRAKERLRESAEYTGAIVDTVREPLLVLRGGEMEIQSANPAFYRVFGGIPGETEGRSLYGIGDGQWDIPSLRTRLEETLSRDTPFEDFEVEQNATGSSPHTLLLNARRLRLGGSGGPRILLAMEDITARKRAERDLLLFKFICDRSHDPYYLMDREERFVYVNRSAYERPGYEESELLALGLTDVDPILAKERFAALFDLAQTTRVEPFESEHVTKRGELFPVEYTITGLNYNGRALLLAVVRDITEQRKSAEKLHLSEEKLRQSQKTEAIGKLAGGIAHDFNNLLTAVNGYSELSLAMVPAENPLHGNLEEILQAGKRAASLTHKLLAYSRKQVLVPKVLCLNDVVSDTRNVLQRVIGEHIELITVLDPALGLVKADPTEMEQVIANLVMNARDAMPQGGKITLETRNVDLDERYAESHPMVIPGKYTLLTVSDTGTGMDAEVQERIFDPFFTTKEVGKGSSGLGLSMVQGIVTQSGGRISVQSEPGRGSAFKIYLHRVDAEAYSPEEPLEASHAALRGTETVLMVEDEEAVRDYARKVLEMHGYNVLTAVDGKSALSLSARLGGQPIHLLLTDVILPGMNGNALAERLVRERPELRIVFMSGFTDDSIVRRSLLEREAQFVQKPFTPSQLARSLRKALEASPGSRD